MFKSAIPVFPSQKLEEKNFHVIFIIDFKKLAKPSLLITGKSEFQVFLNGNLIDYGPAKSAHDYHRINQIKLKKIKENNRITILLASYNVKSFDRVKEKPFIQYELYDGERIVDYSNEKSLCYLNEGRYQKVVRFSYQRNFSESYNDKFDNSLFQYDYALSYQKLPLEKVIYGQYLSRNIHYPKLNKINFILKEKGKFHINQNLNPYQDRYMYIEELGLFNVKDWEVDPNDIVSKMETASYQKLSKSIKDKQFLSYQLDDSKTGFLDVTINVQKHSKIYFYFDELSLNEEHIDFHFYRNTTHNIVSYELNEGEYHLISFIPYTIKHLKVALLEGGARVKKCSLIKLENPDVNRFYYRFENEKINKILDAAVATFAQNAVDILTDCPSRERAGWLCDSYFSARSELLFTGRNLIENNFLENYALYRSRDNLDKHMIPMSYPADILQECYIPNWAMFYVIELGDYLTRHKNNKIINKSKTNIRNLLKFFKKYENEFGLLENLEGWVMIEWSPANDKESIEGVNLPSNMLYANFLENASKILKDSSLKDHAENIKKYINSNGIKDNLFYVDNLIRDNDNQLIKSNRYGETTQYYALYFDFASKNNNPELFDIMVHKFGPNRDMNVTYKDMYKSNVFIGDYLRLEVLLRNGYREQVLNETIDYFYKMALMTGTLWEHDSVVASLNHGFASFVANLIVYSCAGIKQIDYLNKIVHVQKIKNNIGKFEITIPFASNEFINICSDGENVNFSSNTFTIKRV